MECVERARDGGSAKLCSLVSKTREFESGQSCVSRAIKITLSKTIYRGFLLRQKNQNRRTKILVKRINDPRKIS